MTWLSIVAFFGGFMLLLCADEGDVGVKLISAVLFVLGGMIIGGNSHSREPQAIDVYRDKTTLQITYKDSVPVDTVVIFKLYGKRF